MSIRFLIDADLPRSTADVIRRHGYEAIDVRDIGLCTAKDSRIAHGAQIEGLCIISASSLKPGKPLLIAQALMARANSSTKILFGRPLQ